MIIEVTNTLGNENKEFMSQYTPIEPFGLLGPVTIMEEKYEANNGISGTIGPNGFGLEYEGCTLAD